MEWKKTKHILFYVFGCKCFVLNNRNDNLGKFDAKSDEENFLGYSTNSKAYRVFNKRTLIVEESIHVTFNEDILLPIESHECEDNVTTIIEKSIKDLSLQEKPNQEQIEVINKNHNDIPKEWKYVGSYPKELILGDPSQGIRTRSTYREKIDYIAFAYQVEPHSLEEAKIDPNWMMAMHEELNEFKRKNAWTLVNRPLDQPIIGTKCDDPLLTSGAARPYRWSTSSSLMTRSLCHIACFMFYHGQCTAEAFHAAYHFYICIFFL